MSATRILVLGVSRILREILEEAVAEIPGARVIQHESGSLLHAVAEHDASFVIAGSDSLSMADAGSLLAARPDVKLVAIAENGRRWYAYEMRPHQEPLGEASPERLVQLIRDHAAAPAVGT